jgi:hypothetical protein
MSTKAKHYVSVFFLHIFVVSILSICTVYRCYNNTGIVYSSKHKLYVIL